jgi:NapC/NirT cytochrome c family, N-terminal region
MSVFDRGDQPVWTLLTSHWLTMIGALIATVAGCAWLFTLPSQVRGHAANPYIGILTFIVLPIVFAAGLVLMPIGMWLSKRAIRLGYRTALTRKSALRRLVVFLAVATFLNVVIMSQLSYSAVTYMEGAEFCGQSCHVMKPEFTAYQISPHARVLCVECHVTPGAVGWVQSKMAGARQLVEVVFNTYPRPIKSAMEANRLVPASGTCEKCHWPEQFSGGRLRVIPEYAEDEKNTLSQTVLMMMVGGGGVRGIHGSHFGPGVSIRYASTDSTRQTIPWVEYKNSKTNEARTYAAEGVKPGGAANMVQYDMQCVDCHNRPTHTFQLPERAVNRALSLGRIPVSLPFIRKKGVEILRAGYASSEEAARKIPAAVHEYYGQQNPAPRPEDVELAANSLLAIYNENVFPELGVTWGTYKNNLGHTDYPGCFRCHDEAHASSDGKTITQDCGTCHEIVAASEASPDVLRTLGLRERLSGMQRK